MWQEYQEEIQFNSIQYRHLYAPANEHHVGAHGEETKLQRKIKYMNDKRKKSVNFEKDDVWGINTKMNMLYFSCNYF